MSCQASAHPVSDAFRRTAGAATRSGPGRLLGVLRRLLPRPRPPLLRLDELSPHRLRDLGLGDGRGRRGPTAGP